MSYSTNSSETNYSLIRIIFTHVYSYGLRPYERSNFLEKIEKLIKNTKMESDRDLRVILIWTLEILGYIYPYVKSGIVGFELATIDERVAKSRRLSLLVIATLIKNICVQMNLFATLFFLPYST